MKKVVLVSVVLVSILVACAQAGGRSTATPVVSLSLTRLTFASQTVATTSPAQSVTLTNTGQGSLSISSISASGNFAETNNCGLSLAARASCSISVTFTPTAAGTPTGAISITDNAPSRLQHVSLSGTGVAAVPALTITSSSLPTGMVGTPYSATLTAVNGTSPYTWTDPACNGSCNTGMGFGPKGVLSGTPVNAGTSTFTFMVVDAKGKTATTQLPITITAAAVAPVVNLSPTSLTFGSQTVASTSPAQSVTLTNTGKGLLSISGIGASGDFAETNICGSSLPANASCTISVTFTPTATGTRTGAILFTDNGASSTQQVSLSGTAVAATSTTLQASASSLSFGSITTGTSSTRTLVITNIGNASATISQISAGSTAFSVAGVTLPTTVAAGASLTLTASFTPATAGSYTDTLSLQSNATNSTLSVGLSGTAVAPVQHQVTLSWAETSGSVMGYNVYRSTQSGTAYTGINLSLNASQSYSDSSVSAGQTYYYVVTAVNESGVESAYSAQVSAVVPTP